MSNFAQRKRTDHMDMDCDHLGLRSIVQKGQGGRGGHSWKMY